jgi:hypothetical protein
MARRKNLRELIEQVAGLDVDSIDKTRIKQMYLDVIYRCLEEEANPKALEVALRAISSLASMLDEETSSSLDEELRSKMPDSVLKVLGRI